MGTRTIVRLNGCCDAWACRIGITVAAMSATKSTFAIHHRIGEIDFVIWDSWPDSVNWKALFDSGKRYFVGTEEYICIYIYIYI